MYPGIGDPTLWGYPGTRLMRAGGKYYYQCCRRLRLISVWLKSIAMEGSMRPYRCYFRTTTGHIVELETIRCAGDDEARETAARLFREQSCHAVEVWDVGHQLMRLTRDAARAS